MFFILVIHLRQGLALDSCCSVASGRCREAMQGSTLVQTISFRRREEVGTSARLGKVAILQQQ